MSQPLEDLLFVGTRGYVCALRKDSGEEAWRSSLPGTGHHPVHVVFEDGLLFCGTNGHVLALDPVSGEVLWTNSIPGLGHELICLTTAGLGAASGFTELAAAQQEEERERRRRNST